MSTPSQDWQRWFEGVWAEREERVYPRLFGDIGRHIHTLPAEVFERLGVREIDPRWLTHGVFESPPRPGRESWLYVTSALSNPWGDDPATIDPGRYSGLGMELLMQTPAQAPWAIGALHWLMAVQLLAAAGRLEGGLVELHDRIPLHASIDPARDSALRNLILLEPRGLPPGFQLASGRVDLLLCLGLTDPEMELVREQGVEPLLSALDRAGVPPLTDPDRASVV